jgi:hypothetical protein
VDKEASEAIQTRLDRLGISRREFHELTGIDRKTLGRAVAGEERVRASTHAAIARELDRLETAAGMGGPGVQSPESRSIEFEVASDEGLRVVVKGPVSEATVLRGEVAALISARCARGVHDSPRLPRVFGNCLIDRAVLSALRLPAAPPFPHARSSGRGARD